MSSPALSRRDFLVTLAAAGRTKEALSILSKYSGDAVGHANLGYLLAATGGTVILAHVEATVPGSLTHGLEASTTAESLLWEDYADTAINGYLVLARWIDDANWAVVMPTYFAGAPWFVKKLIAPKIRATVRERLVARDVLRHASWFVRWARGTLRSR